MTIHQEVIHHRLKEFGWELAAQSTPKVWWADETWRLRSILSPLGAEIYLTFLVDPRSEIHDRQPGENIYAVKASATPPAQRLKGEGEYILEFDRDWRERLSQFFSHLSLMRDIIRSST